MDTKISKDICPGPGDIAISYFSFLDIESALTVGPDFFSDREVSSPFEASRFLLNIANLLEAIVTQGRILCFGIDEGPAFPDNPNVPVTMLPWKKFYSEFESEIAQEIPSMAGRLETAVDNYDSFIETQYKHEKISHEEREIYRGHGKIILGDLFRARDFGINFYPNALETGACMFKIIEENVKGTNIAKMAIDLIESARKPLAIATNERLKAQVYDIYVPAVFGAILNEAKTFDDLFKIALQMRDTREAKNFRDWVSSIDNDTSLNRIHKELKEIQALADDLAKGVEQKPREVQLQFGISFIGSIQLTIPISLRTKMKRHLTFLQSLFNVSSKIIKLDMQLRRVFGGSFKDAQENLKRISGYT